jgi:hypothetical protein
MPRISIKNETASGGRVGWTKTIKSVDKSKTNGYAFDGDFLNEGKQYDLCVGTVIVSKDPFGSARNGGHTGHIGTVEASGIMWDQKTWDWGSQFLDFRDAVVKALIEAAPKTEALPSAADLEIAFAKKLDADFAKIVYEVMDKNEIENLLQEREVLTNRLAEINKILDGRV